MKWVSCSYMCRRHWCVCRWFRSSDPWSWTSRSLAENGRTWSLHDALSDKNIDAGFSPQRRFSLPGAASLASVPPPPSRCLAAVLQYSRCYSRCYSQTVCTAFYARSSFKSKLAGNRRGAGLVREGGGFEADSMTSTARLGLSQSATSQIIFTNKLYLLGYCVNYTIFLPTKKLFGIIQVFWFVESLLWYERGIVFVLDLFEDYIYLVVCLTKQNNITDALHTYTQASGQGFIHLQAQSITTLKYE